MVCIREDGIQQCNGVEELIKEKEKTCCAIKEEMINLIAQLRVKAATSSTTDASSGEEKESFEDTGSESHLSYKKIYALTAVGVSATIIIGFVATYGL